MPAYSYCRVRRRAATVFPVTRGCRILIHALLRSTMCTVSLPVWGISWRPTICSHDGGTYDIDFWISSRARVRLSTVVSRISLQIWNTISSWHSWVLVVTVVRLIPMALREHQRQRLLQPIGACIYCWARGVVARTARACHRIWRSGIQC